MASRKTDKQDRTLGQKDIALAGRLVTDIDGTLIGEQDFQELINLRYTNANPRGISGMTRMNITTPGPGFTHPQNAIFVRKQSPELNVMYAQMQYPNGAAAIFGNYHEVATVGDFNAQEFTLLDTWVPNYPYSANVPLYLTDEYYAESCAAGISGSVMPTFPLVEFASVIDNNITWIVRRGNTAGQFSHAPREFTAFCNGRWNLVTNSGYGPIGGFINFDFSTGTFFYDFTDRINDESNDPHHVAPLSSSGGYTALYIGTELPVDGWTFYVDSPSAPGGALVNVNAWDGNSYSPLTFTDGTNGMQQSGKISVSYPFNPQTSVINNIQLFWYSLVFQGISNNSSLYYVRSSIPWQPLQDIWDGSLYPIAACAASGISYTTAVLKQDGIQTLISVSPEKWDYAPQTVMSIGGFGNFYVAFSQRMSGLSINLADPLTGNSNHITCQVAYWNGSAWIDVTNQNDQTITFFGGGYNTFGKSGYITWNSPDVTQEYQLSDTADGGPTAALYYYRVSFVGGTPNVGSLVDSIFGIPAPIDVQGYNVPIEWLGSLWLCGKRSGQKNEVINSASGTVSVWKGPLTTVRTLGKNTAIVAGCTLFSRYSSALTETMLLFKSDETYELDGADPQNVVAYRVSGVYGCTGPRTLAVCDLGYEIAPGVNKAVAIWQSQNGIIMFDNGSFLTVSQDLDNYFTKQYDNTITNRINPQYHQNSYGFYDPLHKEYHWLFADGSSSNGVPNREFAFDILRKRWFEIQRGLGQPDGVFIGRTGGPSPVSRSLVIGQSAWSKYGVPYTYGFDNYGHYELLENGNTMDGPPINYKFRIADKPLQESMAFVGQLHYVKFECKSFPTSGVLTVTHYGDQNNTGEIIATYNPNDPTKRVFRRIMSFSKKHTFHSLEFSISTSDVPIGLEPIALSYLHKFDRYDTKN
jgi:hypothetical protein